MTEYDFQEGIPHYVLGDAPLQIIDWYDATGTAVPPATAFTIRVQRKTRNGGAPILTYNQASPQVSTPLSPTNRTLLQHPQLTTPGTYEWHLIATVGVLTGKQGEFVVGEDNIT